ncbi:unnamed protein product, partial [Pylaiella littoralis]
MLVRTHVVFFIELGVVVFCAICHQSLTCYFGIFSPTSYFVCRCSPALPFVVFNPAQRIFRKCFFLGFLRTCICFILSPFLCPYCLVPLLFESLYFIALILLFFFFNVAHSFFV